MLAKRIIPCLDVKGGRVVKGVNFVDLVDAGDPAEIARKYNEQGADELVFLDIAASNEARKTMVDVVRRTVCNLTIPLTVGGGVSSVEDIRNVLEAGAAKVSIGSAAYARPELIAEAAKEFGSNRIVVAIDARKLPGEERWSVCTHGGQKDTGVDPIEWAVRCAELGAGQILLTSMDGDGVRDGYDYELTRRVADAVSIPVIASGGAGKLEHFAKAVIEGHADAVLAASVFHFGTFTVPQVKQYLKEQGITVKD